MDTRNHTIDVAKGLGIILIVFGHSDMVLHTPKLLNIIFSFHIPLFFFLSGVFLKSSEPFWYMFRKRTDGLLKPYFSILGIVGIFAIALGHVSMREYLLGISYATSSTIVGATLRFFVPLWFLPHLFITLVFSYLVLEMSKNLSQSLLFRVPIYISMISIGANFIDVFRNISLPNIITRSGTTIQNIGLPFSIDIILVSSGFILLGNLLSKQAQSLSFKPIIVFGAITTFFACHYFYNETIDLNDRLYGNFLISTIQSFLGIYITLSISSLLSYNKIFSRLLACLGASSLFILIFHWSLMWSAWKVFHVKGDNILGALLGVSLGVIVPLFLQEISKKYWILKVMLLPSKI